VCSSDLGTIARVISIHFMTHLHPPPRAMLASVDLWHRRLGHPNKTTLSSLLQEFSISLVLVPLMIPLFVMPVNAANMFDYLLGHLPLLALFRLNYSIVISGPPQLLVFRVINIIL